MSDTTIDERLRKIFFEAPEEWIELHTLMKGDAWDYIECAHIDPEAIPEIISKVKSALYDLILKEVVGANRHDIVEVEGTDITDYMNMHRSLQRNKLKELFDGVR